MQWFYEIVIALLLFSVLLFCTAIISSKYDIETEILEESSVRKILPWATELKRSRTGRSFNATHPTLTLLTDLFTSNIVSSQHFTNLMKGEGSQRIESSDHKRSVSISSTPMVKSFHRHRLYPTTGLSVSWCWGGFQSTLAQPSFSLSVISPYQDKAIQNRWAGSLKSCQKARREEYLNIKRQCVLPFIAHSMLKK